MATKIFKDYYSRIAKEGFIKALMFGAIIGFASMLATSIILWIVQPDLFWLAFIVLGVVAAAATAALYFIKFRPTTKQIAQRVDLLGLEERILTMTELEGDTSYIAMKQREDALAALKTVTAKNLKMAFSVPVIVSLSIVAVFAAGMTTVAGLTSAGIVPTPEEIAKGPEPDPEEFEVVYEIMGEGDIFGESIQMVMSGEDATAVYAEAFDGWAFVEWNDGINTLGTDPFRQDFEVTKNMTIYAVFAEAQVSDGGEDGEPADGAPGEGQPSDKPGESDNSSNSSNQSGPPSQNPGDGAGNSESNENNRVVDGNTNLGDVIGDASAEATEGANQNSDISDAESAMIGGYMGGIGGGAGGSGSGSGDGSN